MPTWTQWVTFGLAVSSATISVGLIVTRWWTKREATVTAIVRQTWGYRVTGEPTPNQALVIQNLGPHVARDVDLEYVAPHQPLHMRWSSELPPLPVSAIHPGEEFHIGVLVTMAAQYTKARLTWRDGRRGPQEKEVVLSVQRS